MKRVLLIVGISRKKAQELGAQGVVDRIENGEYPDVSMGCFPAGTLVTLGDGTRIPIEQIKEGDEVISHTGRKRKVVKTHQRKYKGELYSIKAEAHRVIRCTRQHPFLAVAEDAVKFKDQHSNWNWRNLVKEPFPEEWIHAECLHDQYLLEPIMYGPPLGKYELPEGGRAFARVLGYYLAEGHLLRNKKGELAGIELTTNRNDPVHDEITELCAQLGTDNTPSFRPRDNSEESVAISIFDKDLAQGMLECAGVYSTEKKLAEEIMLWPKELLLELLGAYANGDGCGYDGTIKFSTASESLAWQLVALLPRVGAIPSVSQLKHKAGSGMSRVDTYEWVVHVGKQWAPILAPYSKKIVPVEVQKTKRSRFLAENLNRIITPIREIESMYVETEVFNLEVEEDESYLVEGLAVHNCKVPFDVCSICGEMDFIRPFLGKPNEIVRLHKQRPIRGISTTTNEYCQHLKFELNKIYPDGQRVMMLNIHPRFFDISFVFIGADKTSKMLAKLAAGQCPIRLNAPICKHGCTQCNPQGVVPSAHVYNVWSREKVASDPVEEILMGAPTEEMTYEDRFVTTLEAPAVTKTAAMSDELLKEAYGLEEFEEDPRETARVSDYFRRKIGGGKMVKKSEIAKRVSSHFGRYAPAIEQSEPDIPHEVQDEMAEDLPHALSSAGGMGIVVKPREFQRMMLVSSGNGKLADDLDHRGMMFRPGAPMDRGFGIADTVVPRILAALMPMLHQRSSFGPALHKRITIVIQSPSEGHRCDRGHMRHMGGDLMDKISSAYTSYRRGLIYKTASLIPQALHEKPEILNHLFGGDLVRSFGGGLVKEGGDVMESLIGGMLPVIYLNQAHFGGPVSMYVQEHLDLEGLTNVGGLAAFGGLA